MMNKTLPLTLLLLPGAALAHLEYYDLNKMYRVEDLMISSGLTIHELAGKLARGEMTLGDLSAEDLAIYNGHDTPLVESTHDKVMNGAWTFTSTPENCALGEADCVRSVTVNDLNLSGWIDGTRELPTSNPTDTAYHALGDSHVVDFANFHLDQDAYVTIDFKSPTGINPSFTLYKGLFVYQGHDDALVDHSNPTNPDTFELMASERDSGNFRADWQGHVSPFRDTVHSGCGDSCQYMGQFDALHSWSQANISWSENSDYWTTGLYITHVTSDNLGATQNTLTQYCLKAGDYSIAFSGAGVAADNTKQASNENAPAGKPRSGLTGTLSLSAENTTSCENLAPTIEFGAAPVLVDEGDEITLKADAKDPNGDSLSYQWEQISGPSVTLDGATTESPKLIAPQVDPSGADLQFKLTVTDNAAVPLSASATMTFHVRDRYDALNCDYAAPSKAVLWPANKSLAQVGIIGVDGPNPLTLKITGVVSDEPVKSKPGRDSTGPDAKIKPGKASSKRPDTLDSARLRAERQRKGNGRVYTVNFRATDTGGQTCTGAVQVAVPPRKGATATPDATSYNALLRK